MKRFFHDYFYSVVKMFVNQFAIAIFGIALFVATFKDLDTLCLIASAFSVVFYLFLIYMVVWEIGAKDRISVDVGKKVKHVHLGLLLSFIANIPNLILAVICVFLPNLRAIPTLLQGMYWGLIRKISLPLGAGGEFIPISDFWPTYFIIIVPALLTCWLAYYLGYQNFKLSSLFVPEKKKAEKPNIKK